jgi:hypothetical protein
MTRRWWILRQALLPAVLFAAAVASLVYGALYHAVPVERNVVEVQTVQEEHEEEIDIPFAAPPDALIPNPQSAFPDPFFPGPPRPKLKVIRTQTVEKKVVKPVVEDESEAAVVREVTVGGVVLAKSGVLRRTYGPTASGEEVPPPSLCPT